MLTNADPSQGQQATLKQPTLDSMQLAAHIS